MKLILTVLIAFLIVSHTHSEPADDPINPEQGEQRQPSQEEVQRYYSMRRTACIVLSRHFINSRKDDVESTFNQLPQEQQSQYANKLYSTGVEVCEENIAANQVQELFVPNDQFDPSIYFPLFITLDIVGLAKGSLKLNKNQEHIIQSIRQFDDDMAIRKEEQESQQSKTGDDKGDIKLFNISTRDIGPFGKTIYAIIFVALIGGVIVWGFKQLGQSEPKKKDKKKKEASPPKRV